MSGRGHLLSAIGALVTSVLVVLVGLVLPVAAQAAPKKDAGVGPASNPSAPHKDAGQGPTNPPATAPRSITGDTTTTSTTATTTTTTAHKRTSVPNPTSTPMAQPPAPTGNAGTSMSTPGYWLVDSSGEVGSYGGVPFRSSLLATRTNAQTVDLVPTYDGGGYWLTGADGGVFAFGDAAYYGSLNGRNLNAHVVSLAPTSSGLGYWLAAADGGVFAFGNADYYGSPGGTHLAAPVVAMMPTPDSRGYWLVSSDGGVFAYGDARYLGSMVGQALKGPVVGAAATADGGGYWLVSADGGVFAFGDARYFGSVSTTALDMVVMGIAPTPDGGGYWLAAADGGVFAFGDATFLGSAQGDVPPNDHIVAVATGPGVAKPNGAAGNFSATTTPTTPAAPTAPAPATPNVRTDVPGAVGYDISWPQCHGPLPAPSTLAIVGINNGSAFTTNPCFRREARWAGLNLSVYINLNAPDPARPDQFANGPAGGCPPGASVCDFYNYGYNAAANAMAQVRVSGFTPKDVWLDVETSNIWSADTWLNDQVISGAISAVQNAGGTPGLYSTGYQYGRIAGTFHASVPEWLATGVPLSAPSPGCGTPSFTGGRVTLVQGYLGAFDGDFAC